MSRQLQIDSHGPASLDGEALVRAEQCIALLQRRLIKPLGKGGPRSELTLIQYHVLSFLAVRGQSNIAELKGMLGFAQSTTSVIIEKLQKMGLVEKRRDRVDQRVVQVVPLPKGLRLIQSYRKNAETNLVTLAEEAGEYAVRDLFDALEKALVVTALLEKPSRTDVADD